MSDSILERAKRLAAAANQVADQMSMQVAAYAGTVQARKEEDVVVEQQRQQVVDDHAERERERNAKLFKGAAISGSTLVTTYGDIRQWAPRGCSIVIDGNRVWLAAKGEWTAARVELAEDYAGETNLDADIEIPNDSEHAPRASPKRNKAKAVPSGEINSAISGLDSIKFPTNSLEQAMSSAPPGKPKPKKKKRSPDKQQLTARSEYSARAPVSARTDYSYRPSDDSSTVGPFSPHPPSVASNTSFTRGVKPAGSGKTGMNAELFELTDTSTAAMLHEIQVKEELGYPEHSYANMHKRLAEEGTTRAQERVDAHRRQIREQQIEARFATINEEPEPVDVVEKRLQAERQKAMARAAQKRREDEKRIMEKLEKEEVERAEKAARMKEKADRLAAATAERVEKLRREKALAKEKEAERQAAEEARRIESQNKVAQPGYKDKVDRLRAETEQRLQRIKQMDEEKKLRDIINTDRKLRQLAEERGRSVPMHRSTHDRDDDNSSRGSSRSGRPRSVGRLKMDKNAPLYNIKDDSQTIADDSYALPSVSSGRSRSVPTGAGSEVLLRSSSGGAGKSSIGRSKALLKAGVTRNKPLAKPLDNGSNVNNEAQEALVPMHVQSDIDIASALSRKRTPIQTKRDPQGHDSDGDLSGDSLDGKENARRRVDQSDAMSFVSALTTDDGHSYAELHDPAEGKKKSMIPKPVKKKKKKLEVWKMQPIPVKPYIPLPAEQV